MKKLMLLLAVAAIICSPLSMTQAQAGQGRSHKAGHGKAGHHRAHHHHFKHHGKHHKA